MNGSDVDAWRRNFTSYTHTEDTKNSWAHGKRTPMDESFRCPIVLSFWLKDKILSHSSCGSGLVTPVEEQKLLNYVTAYMGDYHKLRAFSTTPFPFPLVQMARTVLFLWVFTLPFCLCHDLDDPVQIAAMLFLATYGYIGLEYVSIEVRKRCIE